MLFIIRQNRRKHLGRSFGYVKHRAARCAISTSTFECRLPYLRQWRHTLPALATSALWHALTRHALCGWIDNTSSGSELDWLPDDVYRRGDSIYTVIVIFNVDDGRRCAFF